MKVGDLAHTMACVERCEHTHTHTHTHTQVIVDDLAHTMRHVRHDPDKIVPVTSKQQLRAGQSYVLLVGWYKQQCCIVRPEFTVADVKAYLHQP